MNKETSRDNCPLGTGSARHIRDHWLSVTETDGEEEAAWVLTVCTQPKGNTVI